MKLDKLWVTVWRFLLLASFSSIGLALGTVILRPAATQAKSETFSFPPQVTLSGWQLVGTEPMEGEGPQQQGQRYRYVQNEHSLDVELWYGRNGNACKRLFQQGDPSASALPLQSGQAGLNTAQSAQMQNTQAQNALVYETDDGSYEYFSQSGVTYLQAVIDSRGGSVVTLDQFIQNRYRYFLRPQPMLRWLMGKETITGGHDCLSAELSLPVRSAAAGDSRPILELAWQNLSRWGYEQLNSKT